MPPTDSGGTENRRMNPMHLAITLIDRFVSANAFHEKAGQCQE